MNKSAYMVGYNARMQSADGRLRPFVAETQSDEWVREWFRGWGAADRILNGNDVAMYVG